ncbi:MAG: polyisoprenoid-binding protein [Granulosicoccus sp.]|nr:polyisoprenoid-binding protein [Granulosicoccus sp.]
MLKSLSVALFLAVCSPPLMASAERFTLDPAHTTVAFLVEHLGFARTLGYFSDVSGTFTYDDQSRTVSDVKITVNTDSVQSDDKSRDKHLRNKDFLNVGNYPEMIFTADSATLDEAGSGELAGSLLLLGETRPLTLSVKLNKAGRYPFGHKKFTLGVSASGSLLRSEFGMDYGVANGLVGDHVQLIIEIEGNQQ